MNKLRNKRGEITVGLALTLAWCTFMITRAVVSGEIVYPQWTKEKTVDTVENPALPSWCNDENASTCMNGVFTSQK